MRISNLFHVSLWYLVDRLAETMWSRSVKDLKDLRLAVGDGAATAPPLTY